MKINGNLNVEGDVKQNNDTVASSPSIAAEYDATATYAIGDYCTHAGLCYRCSAAISVAEAWNAAHWTRTSVAEELSDVAAAIPQVKRYI